MTDAPSPWTEIKRLFFAAQDLEPAQRQQFLKEQNATEAVVEEVLRLLDLSDRSESFLEEPVALTQADDTTTLAAGDLIANRYEITALIGRGGMGDVYEARDRIMNEVVALKLIRHGSEPLQTLAERWRREALLARRVTHRGVCRVHDVGERGATIASITGSGTGAHRPKSDFSDIGPPDTSIFLAGTATLQYLQTDFLFSIPFRAFSEKK